jgi:outer membrane protein insertion porin family
MRRKKSRSGVKSAVIAPLLLIACGVAHAAGDDEFTVGDIKVEGLQRISEGTVYNYLPVNIGDKLDAKRLQEALRALYSTGFFRDVEFRRDGATLVVVVLERPSIESFDIKGNKDIKTEDLQKSMRGVGLAVGKTFDRSTLEDVKQYLTDQYFSRGKYGVRIDTKVEETPGNRVKIEINIKEGDRAKIREINIVGATKFKEKELLAQLTLKTPNWLSWYKQDDRYSRESLQGDIEKLRSFYMDRGYANFRIDNPQVTIAPEKDDIFITIPVVEGDVYRVSEVKLAGNMVVPEAILKGLLLVAPGQTFSRKLVTSTQDLISYRLGEDGYAFAKIDPVTTANDETKQVSVTFFVDPGNRAYVRHINFHGTTGINDVVMRREMRQLEGGWLANAALERSKERLQRLPFIEKVEYETNPVAGTPDLVDVDFTIKEGLPGQFGGGIGYSQSQSIILNGNFVHSNFLGTGQRIAVEVNSGKYSKVYSFSQTDPYRSIDGIARTLSLTYRNITQFVSASSDFSTKSLTLAADYGYPISEYQGVHFGVALQDSQLITSDASANQARDWVRQNGETYARPVDQNGDGVYDFTIYGTRFSSAELTAGWAYDTRNRTLFPDRGVRHSLSMSYALPIGSVQYFTANYDYLQFFKLGKHFTFSVNGQVDYGDALGSTTALPPYRQYFAGGPDTVRGYKESRLGPKDNFGNPYGGNLRVVTRFELLFPVPEKWRSQARVAWFYDIGNVFSTGNVKFQGPYQGQLDASGNPVRAEADYSFSYDKLKRSTGIAVQWLAPLGVFRFSYAIPLNAYKVKTDPYNYPDEVEGFQFSVGQAF